MKDLLNGLSALFELMSVGDVPDKRSCQARVREGHIIIVVYGPGTRTERMGGTGLFVHNGIGRARDPAFSLHPDESGRRGSRGHRVGCGAGYTETITCWNRNIDGI